MANHARAGTPRVLPRVRTFGTAAVTARRQLAPLWTRESLLRLGLAFVLATALWLYVTSNLDPQVARSYAPGIAVSVINVPPGLSVTNNPPPVHIRIRVAADAGTVTQSSFRAYVDVSHLNPGAHPAVPVAVVPADPGIAVVSVSPSSVPVVVERVGSKHVPVTAVILRRPPHGYSVGDIRVDPSTVNVKGPQSQLGQVAQAHVYLYLSQNRASSSGRYKPSLVNAHDRPPSETSRVSIDPPRVDVHVVIQSSSAYRTVPIIVPIQGQPQPGVGVSSVSVEPAEITVHGDPGTLSQLDSVSTHPVSVSGRRAGSFRASVAVQVPHGLHAQYRYVTAYVRLGSASSSASLSLPVVPIHVASGLAAQVRPARVLVTVVGSSKALQGARGVSASVDLSGYSAGTRTAHVHISVPSALRVGQVYPPSLNVRLTQSTK